MDPAGVDFRNFFPYIPNEVKHRKRTSTEQAKVLEGVFAKNPKPDSKLRSRLAEELDMKPRGVQVWFQNRRAKEKLNCQKAQAASAQAARKAEKKKIPTNSQEDSPTQASSPADNHSSPSSSRQPSSSPESSPPYTTTDVPLPEIAPAPPAHDSSPKVTGHVIRPLDPPRPALDLYNLRRGSLPNLAGSHAPQSQFPMGPPRPIGNHLARRGSVERLRSNPFAQYISRPRPAPYQARQTSLRESFSETQGSPPEPSSWETFDALAEARDQHSALVAPGPPRRMLSHRASMPHVFAGVDMTRRASMPANRFSGSPSVPPLQMPPIDRHGFVASRMVSGPIPGPLPSPEFSFGQTPDLANYSFGDDTEDDTTSAASYDPWSRIGSVASTSSTTSGCFSEVGSCSEVPAPQGWNPEARRDSYASSEQFSNLVSRLELTRERSKSNNDIHVDIGSPAAYAHQPVFSPEGDESNAGADYPSPSSTVSPGANFHNDASCLGHMSDPSSQNLPISGSSELAHALRADPELGPPHVSYIQGVASSSRTPPIPYQVQSYPSNPEADIDPLSSARPALYAAQSYPGNSDAHSNLAFNHPTLGSHSMSVPNIPKSFMDVDADQQYSGASYYQNSDHHNTHVQPVSAQNHHPEYQADVLELHHAMEFGNSGYVSGAVDMSHVTSVVENTLHPPADGNIYVQYI